MIQLDLNNPEFQANLLAMNTPEAGAVLKTLRLLSLPLDEVPQKVVAQNLVIENPLRD